MPSILGPIILKKLVEEGFNVLKDGLKKIGAKDKVDFSHVEKSVDIHLNWVNNWCNLVSFSELQGPKTLHKIYLELDLYVTPQFRQFDDSERQKTVKTSKLLFTNNHIVILGKPGAGKSTTVKKFCLSLLTEPELIPSGLNFPIVIELRNLQKGDRVLFKVLFQSTLGLKVEKHEGEKDEFGDEEFIVQALIPFLDSLGCLLVLDGFDEITDADHKADLIQDVRLLALSLNVSKVVITSRSGDFSFSIDNAKIYELCPLNQDQIHEFVTKWLGVEKREEFLRQLQSSPLADTAFRPLNLSHLCAIFERIGRIPTKPKTIYRKLIMLFIDEWDEQRSVVRSSNYASFDKDIKFDFLSDLAFELTVHFNKNVFTGAEIESIYTFRIAQNFNLPKRPSEIKNIVRELETHHGLFIRSGNDSYEFEHKSFQEYLTAEHLIRLPSIPDEMDILSKIPEELAIATSLSSKPSKYLIELLSEKIRIYTILEIEVIVTELFRKRVFTKRKILKDVKWKSFVLKYITRLEIEDPDLNSSWELGLTLMELSSIASLSLLDEDQDENNYGEELNAHLGKFFSNEFVKEALASLYMYYTSILNPNNTELFFYKRTTQISYLESSMPLFLISDKNIFPGR